MSSDLLICGWVSLPPSISPSTTVRTLLHLVWKSLNKQNLQWKYSHLLAAPYSSALRKPLWTHQIKLCTNFIGAPSKSPRFINIADYYPHLYKVAFIACMLTVIIAAIKKLCLFLSAIYPLQLLNGCQLPSCHLYQDSSTWPIWCGFNLGQKQRAARRGACDSHVWPPTQLHRGVGQHWTGTRLLTGPQDFHSLGGVQLLFSVPTVSK